MAQGRGDADEPFPQTRCSAARWPCCVSARRARCRASCSSASAPSRPGVRTCASRLGLAFREPEGLLPGPQTEPPGSTGSRGKKREFLSRNHSRDFSAIPPNPRSVPLSAAGLDIDGLYRISGNLATIQKLRYKVDHGEARPLSLPQARGRKGMLTSSSSPPPFPQMNVWTWTTDAGRTST